MTVIKPNSVAGINSITVQSGEALSVHKSDGSLIRTIVSASGVSTFTSASVGAATTDNNRDASINIGLGASISQHTVNSLSLGTGGDERVSIKSDGKVGINESSPAVFGVHSTQSSESVYYRADSGSVDTIFGSSTALGYAIAGTQSNHDLTLWANNSPRVRIKTSGDVGIGTDTLNAPLTVVNHDNAGYIASFRQKHASNSAQIIIDSPSDSNVRPTSIDLAQAGTVKWSLGQAYAALSDRAFHVATSSLSANDTNARLTISTTGKVGISSRSPLALLTVGPNPNAARSSHPTVLISPASGNATLMLRGNSPTIDFDSTGGGTAQVCTDNADLTINAGTLDDPSLNSGELVRITSGGVVKIGGDTANSADIDTSNSKLTIKQSANSQEDGIYIERSGERRGFYIYVGGALGQSDALGVVSNQLGGDTAVLSIDRGGDVVVGAGNIKMNTAGKGIDFSAQTPSSATGATTGDEVLDHYEEGTWTPVPTLTYNPNGRSITLGGNNAGVYTKVGRIVHLEFVAHWTAISGSGSYNVGVNGLPFAADATTINNGGSGRSNMTGYLFGLESIQNSQVNVLRRYDNGSPNTNDIIHCFAVYTASS